MKLFSSAIISLSLFSASIGTISPASAVYAVSDNQDEVASIEVTSPLDDLLYDENFKTDYLNGLYKANSGTNVELVNFSEYKYDTTYNDKFGLYLYLFNPSQIRFDYFSYKNKISLKVNDNYTKYHVTFVSKTTGDDDSLFLKYKIDINEDFYNSLNSNSRKYDLASIELLVEGKNNATDYKIGATFAYSGFAKGVNNNSESTLKCNKEGLDVIKIKVNGGSVRSSMIEEERNKYQHFKDLFYVYFTIPNKYLTNYGELYAISYEYYKYKLDKNFYVLKNGIASNEWYNWCGTRRLYTNNSSKFSPSSESWERSYNSFPSDRLFRVNNYDDMIPSSLVEERINTYGISNFSSVSRQNAYSGIRTASINDAPIDVESMNYDEWVLSFIGGMTMIPTFTHHKYEGTDWSQLKIIEKISSPESDSGKKYTIDNSDTADFNKVYANSVVNDETMYLFRFELGDYYTTYIYDHHHFFLNMCMDSTDYAVGYKALEDAIIDFDIISFSFIINDEITVIPVCSDPINIIPDLTPPVDTRVNNPNYLKMIIAILMVILLIVGVAWIIKSYRENQNYKASKLILKKEKENKKYKKRE